MHPTSNNYFFFPKTASIVILTERKPKYMANPAAIMPTMSTGINKGLSVFLNAWYNRTGAKNMAKTV